MDERQPVQVGIDLRPIPLVVGEETYHFNPDPDGAFFAAVARIRSDKTENYEFVESLRKVMADQIVVPAEKKAFLARKLGLPGLNAVAKTYSAAVLADPTSPPTQ